MTAREREAVRAARDRRVRLGLAAATETRRAFPRIPARAKCVYCGTRLPARHAIACAKHRDVLAADPKYAYLRKAG